jgi:hypothetical protein
LSTRPILRARAAASPTELVTLAVKRRLCLSATYNRNQIRLAPHALYTKHDEWHVDGVVLERDGQAPRELKLGTFKLTGLKALALTAVPFAPEPLFDPQAERYGEDALRVAAQA